MTVHALFLSPSTNHHGHGRLNPKVINTVWNQLQDFAEVDKDKVPHSARHTMGGVHYGENRQCSGGATAVGIREYFLFSAVFPNNQE